MIPALGASGAAEFQAALIADVVRKLGALRPRVASHLFLAGEMSRRPPVPSGFKLLPQRGRDLGARLENAFQFLLSCHAWAIILGTDSPTLPARLLRAAMSELRVCDAVLGPCPDGGFYLVGLRRSRSIALRKLFRGVRWSSAFAFHDTLGNFLRRQMSCAVLEPWTDVDRPEDLMRLERDLLRNAPLRRQAPTTWRFLAESRARLAGSATAGRGLMPAATGPARSSRPRGPHRRSKTPLPGRA